MKLQNAKQTLQRLQSKYRSDLESAVKDIKPDYNGRGLSGYTYDGITDRDRQIVYTAISTLRESVRDPYGAIEFDVEEVFITEANALDALKKLTNQIERDVASLSSLKARYENIEQVDPYPINECLRYHEEIHQILTQILKSEEVLAFEEPLLVETLKRENFELRFGAYWRKQKLRYIAHLASFVFFFGSFIWLVININNKVLPDVLKVIIPLAGAIFSVTFNIAFNNHGSFKKSVRLLYQGRNVYNEDKKEFAKQFNG